MPVFNGASTVAAAIRSLLDQSFPDFELIISDNASTDATQQVCEHFAALDPRIRYVRQPSNIGAAPNFEYVLNQSSGKYFMWAASDDSWHSQFVERNLAVLRRDVRYVASISACAFGGRAVPSDWSGSQGLSGDFATKIRTFCVSTHANSRFYSLYRRSVLIGVLPLSDFSYVAGDWTLVLKIAKQGDFHLDEGLVGFFKSEGGWGSGLGKFKYSGKLWVEHLVPYYRFSRALWRLVRSEPISAKYQALRCMVRFNLAALREQRAKR